MSERNKHLGQIINSKVLYGMVGLNVGMFVFSFLLANVEMMTLNLFSGLACYIAAKINSKSEN